MNLTVQDLRQVLFTVENQDLTVKELREILFSIGDQEIPVTPLTFGNLINLYKGSI